MSALSAAVTASGEALAAYPSLLSAIPVLAQDDNPLADFSDTPWWLSLVKATFLFIYLMLSVVVVIWFERRIIGRMQQRPGPNRLGPLGILQTLGDGIKLFLKEDIRPKGADAIMYVAAPIIVACAAFISFAIIPLGGEVRMFGHTTPLQLTDTPVAVLLVLAAAGIGAYGFVLAGWSSGSTYSLLGGLRSTAQVISYEIAMGLSLVAVFLFAGSMSTSQIVAAQSRELWAGIPTWYVLPLFFSFVVYVITMVGETNRLPFDLAEGEGELGGGFHTEYSSMKFAMFFLGEYVNMFTVSALATTLFLGGYHAPWPLNLIGDGMLSEGWWGLLWFTLKMWVFIWFFIWLRGTLLRVRYDQFMKLGWKILIPLSLAWVLAVVAIRAAQEGYFGEGRWVMVITLVIIGVFVIAGLLVWERWSQMRAAAREELMEIPAEVDPFADGYPVPPLPGQKLIEPQRGLGAAQPVRVGDKTATHVDTTDPEDSRG